MAARGAGPWPVVGTVAFLRYHRQTAWIEERITLAACSVGRCAIRVLGLKNKKAMHGSIADLILTLIVALIFRGR